MEQHLGSEILWDYLLEEVSSQERERIATHLSTCSTCQALYRGHRALHAALDTMEHEEPSLNFSNAIMRNIAADAALQKTSDFWI